MGEILKVKNLSKDGILEDISFSIEKGEMAAIMGPSGSGKSTLLYHVSGMEQASAGEILLNDTSVTDMNEDEKARLRLRRMGFVFQQMNMLKNLSILDNILLPADQAVRGIHGGKRRELREQSRRYAEEMMEKMGVAQLKDRRITEVSGGQLQRACICRSMINRPEILFADEPTGALNQSAAAEVMEEFSRLNEGGMTILMVTHDSKVASRCDRILYLLDGKLKGELRLGRRAAGTEKRREEKVAGWLAQMGW